MPNLGIARNVLAAKLKDLVADGLLERRRYRTDPDWYEYVLTDAGHDLYGRLSRSCTGPMFICRPLATRSCACATGCGRRTHATVVCAACGEEPTRERWTWSSPDRCHAKSWSIHVDTIDRGGDMAERWFSEDELREMSRPTMDRAIEAIEAGDLRPPGRCARR